MKRLLSLLLALCFFCSYSSIGARQVVAEDTVSQSLDAEREEIERKLQAVDAKLRQLGKESKETEAYIAAMDERLVYLNKQYRLAKNESKSIEKKVETLEETLAQNESDLKDMEDEVAQLETKIQDLNAAFSETYETFCARARAVYISGATTSMLTFLLNSEALSDFFTRYELLRTISNQDGALLARVQEETAIITATKEALEAKKTNLSNTQRQIKVNQANLKNEKTQLLQKQDDMQQQQANIEDQQLEANQLLEKLHEQTKNYGEYRNTTQEELNAIDAEIAAAAKKYARKKTTTTKPATTTAPAAEEDNTTVADSTTSTTTQPSGQYISLTYPCPKYTTITCGFGAYEGHTGCDFSTKGNENQRIVAAESGTVILVKLLETSYGHYLVIMHDKTTSTGKEVYTLYAHNNNIIVQEGEHVEKGQQIAYSGSTGNSTGPHCHFEVRIGGSQQRNAVNPANYLP